MEDDVTLIQEKLEDTSAEFQTVQFTKCFEWWCDHCVNCC